MSTNNFYSNVWILASISFISSIGVGFALLYYALFTDYVYFELGQFAISLEAQGLIGSLTVPFIEGLQDNILILIPNIVDWLWALAFITFMFGFFRNAYLSKRESYFSFLTFTTYTIMLFLFVMGIFSTLSTWFNEQIINQIMPTLIYSTPFFGLYLSNLGLVNMIIIMIAIVLNFVDLETTKFNFRKQAEKQGSELS